MHIDFKKLFKDVTKYPDTLKLKIGDEEMELGVLRAWNTDNEGALVKQLEADRAALTADQDKIDKARKEVADLYLQVAAEKDKLPKGTSAGGNEPPDPYEGLTDDPIAGKLAQLVKKAESERKAEVTAIREESKKLLDAIQKMGVTYMNDRARGDYAALTSDPDYDAKDANLGLDKLYELAVKQGFKDQVGIPDVRRAFREATADKRVARLVKEAEERGAKNAQESARMSAILPKPSTGRPFGQEKPQYKDIDGALEAAMQDASIWTGTVQ